MCICRKHCHYYKSAWVLIHPGRYLRFFSKQALDLPTHCVLNPHALWLKTTQLSTILSQKKGSHTVEDLLPVSCAQEVMSLWPQRLPSHSPHISLDEGSQEACLGPPPLARGIFTHAQQFAYQPRCCCTVRITFDFSSTSTPSSHSYWEAVDNDGWLTHGLLDYWLPDTQATVCLSWHCTVWCGGEWRGGTTGLNAGPIPVHPGVIGHTCRRSPMTLQ